MQCAHYRPSRALHFHGNSVAGAFDGSSTVGPVNDIDDVDAAVGCERELLDPMSTPLRGMGAVAECFARLPGVVHSGHPAVGFIAQGPLANELMSSHDLVDGLGDRSPLARLEAAGADIVLIGVGHGNNTALHLAECRALGAAAPRRRDGVPMLVDAEQRWVEYFHVDFDESDFVVLGDAYAAAGGTEARAPLGAVEIRRLPMRELIDFAIGWIAEHRLQRR